jgi:hypothetical protein
MRGAAGHAHRVEGRSDASAERCRRRASSSLPPSLELRRARPWPALWGGRAEDSAVFSRHEPFTSRAECDATLLGRHACSCARCWYSDGAAGECCPDSSRLVLTGGGGRTPGCLNLRGNGGHGSPAHICSATFGRHESATPSLRPFSPRAPTIFATF